MRGCAGTSRILGEIWGISRGQIAHLDQNNENFDEDNLVFLCLEHHDEYDSKTRTSKGLRLEEVKRW